MAEVFTSNPKINVKALQIFTTSISAVPTFYFYHTINYLALVVMRVTEKISVAILLSSGNPSMSDFVAGWYACSNCANQVSVSFVQVIIWGTCRCSKTLRI